MVTETGTANSTVLLISTPLSSSGPSHVMLTKDDSKLLDHGIDCDYLASVSDAITISPTMIILSTSPNCSIQHTENVSQSYITLSFQTSMSFASPFTIPPIMAPFNQPTKRFYFPPALDLKNYMWRCDNVVALSRRTMQWRPSKGINGG